MGFSYHVLRRGLVGCSLDVLKKGRLLLMSLESLTVAILALCLLVELLRKK